jgi:hypothetical protein
MYFRALCFSNSAPWPSDVRPGEAMAVRYSVRMRTEHNFTTTQLFNTAREIHREKLDRFSLNVVRYKSILCKVTENFSIARKLVLITGITKIYSIQMFALRQEKVSENLKKKPNFTLICAIFFISI